MADNDATNSGTIEQPFDLGPLIDLVQGLRDGSLGIDAAKVAARDHGARGTVSATQLVTVARAALNEAEQGDWRRALPVAELAYEAARSAHQTHAGDPDLAQAWLLSGADLLEILHCGVIEHGDIRLYLRAAAVTEETLAGGKRLELPFLEGLISLRFGSLLLDAYTAGRSPSNYEGQFNAWIARAVQPNDPELIWMLAQPVDGPGDKASAQWPKPLEALEKAESYLRAALPLVIPERRGRTLKAIMQALEWRGLLGGAVDADEIRAVGEQALAEFDSDDLQPRLAVTATLQRLGESFDSGQLVTRLEHDLEGFLAENDEPTVWEAILQAVSLLEEADPVRALALLQQRRRLPQVWADETRRARHFEAELLLFSRTYGAPAGKDLDAAAGQAVAAARSAASAAAARAAAADLVAVMLAATSKDREALALTLMQSLGPLDASLLSEHAEALDYMAAALLRGEGVNRRRAGAMDEAGHYYRMAVDAFRKVGMVVPMLECLAYVGDVLGEGTTELRDEITAWLAASSLGIELAAPSGGPAAVQRLTAHLLAAQVSAGTSAEVVQMLVQVANGRRFGAMLAAGTRGFRLDDAAHLFGRVAQAEAELPAGSDMLRPAPFDAALGDDDVVTAWVNEYETGPADTPADRVAGLQRTAERHLSAMLVPAAAPPIVSVEEIKQRLGVDTALVQLLEGSWVDGRVAIFQLLLTRDIEKIAIGIEEMPYGTVQASWHGRSVSMPASGFYVASMRRAVQAEPGPLDVSSEAEDQLAGAMTRYFRVVDGSREQLAAAGIKRLIVLPHGSSRYVPLHLVGPPGHPIADDWTVTYVTNLRQLMLDPPQGPARDRVGVFALSYANRPGLPRLEDSAAEAQAIAAVCGTTPALDDDATEPAFMNALQTCRYVHLRAHGRLYVDAPSFHTVFLEPADGHDGRVRAYEVLPLDLTGLELVTLGACETALGRVDQADNPRGLPAALLLAGARAVVGTLWPVLADASRCFFTEIYRTLMANQGDVVTAFASAQRATRKEFPQYRDWGAFYLVGGVA